MTTILGLGNPLLDISVTVSELSLAEKYSLKMGDACLASAEQFALYGELESGVAGPVAYIAGGATQNTIRVAQWISGAPSGYTAYIGSVGSDTFGTKLQAAAEADGVKVLYQVQPADGKPTGTCAVIVHNKERSLCANLAAAEALNVAHLETPAVAAAIDEAKFIYTAGFPLTHEGGAASCVKLGEAAVASAGSKKYAINLSAPFICQVRFLFLRCCVLCVVKQYINMNIYIYLQ
jgi:adenosine kinase